MTGKYSNVLTNLGMSYQNFPFHPDVTWAQGEDRGEMNTKNYLCLSSEVSLQSTHGGNCQPPSSAGHHPSCLESL